MKYVIRVRIARMKRAREYTFDDSDKFIAYDRGSEKIFPTRKAARGYLLKVNVLKLLRRAISETGEDEYFFPPKERGKICVSHIRTFIDKLPQPKRKNCGCLYFTNREYKGLLEGLKRDGFKNVSDFFRKYYNLQE